MCLSSSMTMLSEQEHTARRRTYAAHYSMSQISRFQEETQRCIIQLVNVSNLFTRTSHEFTGASYRH